MATIALPLQELDDLEQESRLLLAGLDYIQNHEVERAFDHVLERSDDVLRHLNDPQMQLHAAPQLLELAAKLDALVMHRKQLAARVRSLNVPAGNAYLDTLNHQCERFDGFAETFRLAADPGMRARIGALLKASHDEAAKGKPKADWRDFVGSLRD